MIKYFFIMIFSGNLVFCLQSFGQTADRVANDTSRLIINKWKITAMKMQGQKINWPLNSKDFFEFKPDGTVTISESGTLHKEEWNYDKHDRVLIMDENYGISKINKLELVLFSKSRKEKMVIYLKKGN